MKLRNILVLGAAAAAIATVAGLGWRAEAQDSRAPAFTAAQAQRGHDAYVQNCALCHGDNLSDGEFAPALKGAHFRDSWGGKTTDALFSFISQMMPPTSPGLLGPDGYADVTAFILQANGLQAGDKPLPAEEKALATTTIPKS